MFTFLQLYFRLFCFIILSFIFLTFISLILLFLIFIFLVIFFFFYFTNLEKTECCIAKSYLSHQKSLFTLFYFISFYFISFRRWAFQKFQRFFRLRKNQLTHLHFEVVFSIYSMSRSNLLFTSSKSDLKHLR